MDTKNLEKSVFTLVQRPPQIAAFCTWLQHAVEEHDRLEDTLLNYLLCTFQLRYFEVTVFLNIQFSL